MKQAYALTRPLPMLAALLLAACAQTPIPPVAPVLPPSLAAAPLAEIAPAIEHFIKTDQMPGATFWVERVTDGASYHRAFGSRALLPMQEPLDEATIFDAASLTKPVVTATAVQLLRERGRLDIEATVARYLPECAGTPVGDLSLRRLLTHSSSLPGGIPGKTDDGSAWSGTAAAIQMACSRKLDVPVGSLFRYSDVNFILLGEIVSRAAGKPLHQFAQEEIFAPLGMASSGYLPLQRFPASRIAPTSAEGKDGAMLRGEVHDPTARRMGGVAGHAGLFTTTADLARFARMLLAGGKLANGRQYLSPESITLLSTVQSAPELVTGKRSLGWDIATAYSRPRGKLYGPESFGHTGFTGCILWIDPVSQSFYVLLANRVHPGRPTNILPLYEQLGTLSARAAGVLAGP